MSLGKKTLNVESKKTPSCVVRLQKVSHNDENNNKKSKSYSLQKIEGTSTNSIKVAHSGLAAMGASSKLVVSEEKKFKGPFKKRPVDNSLNCTQQLHYKKEASFSLSMRSGQKIKIMHRNSKDMLPESEEESPPPTIAAGRSRRAIKPNPKYASEDVLTPKIIRNVVSGTKTFGSTTETKERASSSSSDDFFNHDSSDEMGSINLNEDDDDDIADVAYQTDEKETMDSDFSEPIMKKSPPRQSRGRGRPRKIVLPESIVHTSTKPGSSPSTRVIQIASSTVRAQPTQLQQLRRTLATSTAQRNLSLLSGEKRKLDNDGDVNLSVKRKQLVLTLEDQRSTKGSKENANVVDTPTAATRVIRKVIPTSLQTLNNNKFVKSYALTNASNSNSEKIKTVDSSKNVARKLIVHKVPLNKSVPSDSKSAAPAVGSFTSTQAKILAARATAAASRLKVDSSKTQLKDNVQNSSKVNNNNMPVTSQLKKLNSSDNKLQSTKSTDVSNHSLKGTSTDTTSSLNASVNSLERSPNSSTDTMPTFTIVNVNDIINKKKDVLITTSNLNNKTPCKSSTAISNDNECNAKSEKKTSPNLNQLKTEAIRKPDKTEHPILNHKIAMRNARTTTNVKPIITTPIAKSAPRILNSVVAKKTRPVKPLISSLNDSEDESIPLSMDDDTEDEQDIKDNISGENNRRIIEDVVKKQNTKSESFKQKQPQKQTKNILSVDGRKRSTVVSSSSPKMNSSSVSNSSSLQRTRNITPEKIVISRQGDKIIKKITCFETWYVINIKNDKPNVARNQFEMPLIELANACETIPLPSANWSCKVTLYQLSAATLAKSTFITYTGDLNEHNIAEEDRSKYQPSCVMFRREVTDRQKPRLPYDRAIIVKNKTFYVNIEGKNVKLVAAPSIINSIDEIEILLQIVDSLSLQSDFVEQATTMQ